MKNFNITITTMIIIFLILLFISTIAPFAYYSYNKFNKQFFKILNSHIQHSKNTSQIIIENELFYLSTVSKELSNEYSVNKENLNTEQFDYVDLIFIKSTDGKIINLSSSLLDTNSIIKNLLLKNSIKKGLLTINIKNSEQYGVLLSSKEIVDKNSGRVMANVYTGTILNNNYRLLNKIREKTLAKDTFLYINKTIISSTTPKNTPEYQRALKIINDDKKTQEIYSKEDNLIHKIDLNINGLNSNMHILSVHLSNQLKILKDNFINDITILSIIYFGILILIYFLVKIFIVQPIDELLYFAQNIRKNNNIKYIKSNVKEFNNIASGLEQIIGELRDAKEQYKLAIDGTQDGLWDWNIKEDTAYYSTRYKKMLGFKSDEFEHTYKSWEGIVHPDDLKSALDSIRKHLNQQIPVYIAEFRLRCKDGSYKWILSRGKAIYDENNIPYRMVGFHTDINKLKKLELENQKQTEMMFHQSRLASMGEMIENIAHQWRQPLNVIGALNMKIETKLDFGETITAESYEPIANNINQQLEFMSKTIDDFRDFFNKEKTLTKYNIFEAVKEVYNLVSIQFRNHNIYLQIDGDNIFIYGLKNELKQVLINILNNAKDAIVTKQNLSKNHSGYIKVTLEKIDNNIKITIHDNGGGIDGDIINKIFDPYFTTKFKSQGTGIGLYMSYQIITEHLKGKIQVTNEQITYKNKNYNGASFIILFPANNTTKTQF